MPGDLTTDSSPEAQGGATAALAPSSPPGYELIDEVGRGGMGVVYRAVDVALGRDVAVKVLADRFGPESPAAQRFLTEARITGQLQHPGIPAVHQVGTLPDGRPFLAMKLIRGLTLEEVLKGRPDRGRLLAVFEAICQAVAYAHAHDVIHRDLKPANIMVGAFGEVQVMDWGLAKVLGAETSANPAETANETRAWTQISPTPDLGWHTQAGSLLGTPAYASPEQVAGELEKVDTRADVFGLGAILAVILTGKPPYVGETAETVRVQALRGKLDDCFARLAACGAEPDLVALCKRCLAFEPADRPANVGEVARAVEELRAAADERARQAELERVRVEGERATVEARSAERRKRRRLWLGAAAVLAVAVGAGLTALLAVQRRANADLAAKNAELTAEQAKVEAQNKELAEQQAEVEARFETAQKAIATFHTGVSEDALLKNDNLKELRTKLLKEAAGFYADLEKLLAGKTDPKSRKLLASGYAQLGDLTEKIGDQKEALAVRRRALALRRELAALPGADVEARLDVARSLLAVGRLLRATGDPAGAGAAYKEQREIAAALEAESPTDAVRSVVAQSYHSIGLVLSETGKPTEALAAYEEARAIYQKLADAHPTDTQFQTELARSHNNVAILLRQTGKPAEALAAYRQARAIQQKLADINPDVTQFQRDLALSHNNIGAPLSQTGKPAEALAAYEQARTIRQKLADTNPAVTQFQGDLAVSHYNIGALLSQLGKPAEALAAYEQARAIQQKLSDANPAVTQFLSDLARSHNAIGALLSQTGKPAEALAAYEQARAIQQKLADANPAVTQFQRELAFSHNNIGILLCQTGKPAAALAAYEQARTIRQKLADANPTIPSYRSELATTYNTMGRLQGRQKHFAEAFAALDRGLALRQKLADAHPTTTLYTSHLGYSHAYRGWAHVRAGHPAEGAADLRRAVELWAKEKTPVLETRFERSRALALLAGLGGAMSGVTAAEATAFADQAVAALTDAIKAGSSDLTELKEPDFEAIRGRPDFQKLVAELERKLAANPGKRP